MLRLALIILLLAMVAGCTPPTSTTSASPLLLRSPAHGEIPANFLIYSPTLMGADVQAEFRSDGAGHHLLAIGKGKDGKSERMTGYMRLMRLPLFAQHYVAEVSNEEGSTQLLLRRTKKGFATETIELEKVLKREKIPGIRKEKDGKALVATDIDAVQALFWRALDLADRGKVPKGDPYHFAIYDLDRPRGKSEYDAARQAEADRLAREQAEKEARERREAAERKQKRQRREAERKRKEEAEKTRRANMVRNNNKRYGDWVYRIEIDPMTDRKKQFVYGFPSGFDDPARSPYLRIGCYGATDDYPMGVTFYWGQPLEDVYPRDEIAMARVTVRMGRSAPQEMGWAVSQDWASTYPPNTLAGGLSQLSSGIIGLLLPNNAIARMNSVWTAKDLHNALRRSQQATFRGYPRSGRDATYRFDLTGYRAAIENFENHCNQ